MRPLAIILATIALAVTGAGCAEINPGKDPSQKELANEVYRTCLQRGDMTQYECAEQAQSHR